jgi:cell wall-associated NlpC family hydrolase
VVQDSAHPGDLVFFSKNVSGSVNHVGIFMGYGVFAHASTSLGVTYNSLGEKYFRERFLGIRRYP